MGNREYLMRPNGCCWIGFQLSDGNMAMVSRMTEAFVFDCCYDGESMGDEFITSDVDEALAWLNRKRKEPRKTEYEVFMDKCKKLARKAGSGIKVQFDNDIEHGRFLAKCSDGTLIIGHPSSLKVTVRFHGHQYMTELR